MFAQPSGRVVRHLVSGLASPRLLLPLLPGTEPFAEPYYRSIHSSPFAEPPFDLACYFIQNAIVSGEGNIWLDDCLVTSPEVMPPYVQTFLGLQNGGREEFRRSIGLPVRRVFEPCLVAIGHGTHVYGHFLIEMLFRLLLTQRAFDGGQPRYKVLIHRATPRWLQRILIDDLHIDHERLEFFDPDAERVLLSRAIIPTAISRNERYHNGANDLLEDLSYRLRLPPNTKNQTRIFVARRDFSNPHSQSRVCVNEMRLAAIAKNRFDFTMVVPEELTWRQQITLFRGADIVVGQAGSGLHTALFSRPDTRLASIGTMNSTQSGISALRQQRIAYFNENINLKGNFAVNEDQFLEFLNAVCAEI
jgi:capsular polysaccharide biosynthesis protein